jgi:hypothetical protein
MNYYLKKKYIISDCDIIYLHLKSQKAGVNNILKRINYHLKNYKKLKRRSYSLNFIFFFTNMENRNNREITLDIKFLNYKNINIFITLTSYYIEDFYDIINKLSYRAYKKKNTKKDANDIMLDKLDYVFSWNRLNKVICYDIYMP